MRWLMILVVFVAPSVLITAEKQKTIPESIAQVEKLQENPDNYQVHYHRQQKQPEISTAKTVKRDSNLDFSNQGEFNGLENNGRLPLGQIDPPRVAGLSSYSQDVQSYGNQGFEYQSGQQYASNGGYSYAKDYNHNEFNTGLTTPTGSSSFGAGSLPNIGNVGNSGFGAAVDNTVDTGFIGNSNPNGFESSSNSFSSSNTESGFSSSGTFSGSNVFNSGSTPLRSNCGTPCSSINGCGGCSGSSSNYPSFNSNGCSGSASSSSSGCGHTYPTPSQPAYQPPQVITKEIRVPVPQPYKVIVEKKVPVPVPQPYPVQVPKPVPYRVEVRVPVPVPRPYPVTVTQKVPVRVPIYVKVPTPVRVEVPRPYPVEKRVPYPVQVKVPVYIRVPVPVNSGGSYQEYHATESIIQGTPAPVYGPPGYQSGGPLKK